MARVLIPQDEASSAVRVLNVSISSYMFTEDVCLGSATPATTLESSEELVRDGDCPTCSTQQPGCPNVLESEPDRPLGQVNRPCWWADRPHWHVDQLHWPSGQPQRQGDENHATVGAFISQNEHLEPVIASLPSDLSPDERVVAERLILENSDVFSKSDFDLGRSRLVHHCKVASPPLYG